MKRSDKRQCQSESHVGSGWHVKDKILHQPIRNSEAEQSPLKGKAEISKFSEWTNMGV